MTLVCAHLRYRESAGESVYPIRGVKILRTQYILFRHYQTAAEMSEQFGTSAEVSCGHFGTGTELSRPSANIFAK